MSAEDWEIFKVLKNERREAGVENRRLALAQFSEACSMASRHGMVLRRCSESHYTLAHKEAGWRINIYPGNGRLYGDAQRPQAPFIRVKELAWGLLDVLNAAIEATETVNQGG